MRKLPISTFLLALTLVSLACGSGGTALPATLEPATVTATFPAPQNSPPPPESPPTGLPVPTVQTTSFPGLMVAYIRQGSLWFWSEANGPYQMTDSGDLTDVCISEDGQLLAFIREAEIWTARTDGTDARLLVTRAVPGGRLKFSPSGKLLAISDKDQIQLVDLTTSAITTVLSYPTLASGYEPEVVWSPDSFGLKTIIPAATETGIAEFFYVFATGSVASLAKFNMVPTDESAPFLSPDGGYVIYVAKLTDEKKSLYLMDSSGATKPYGEPVTIVHAYGWQPDSKHFVYMAGNPKQTLIGDVNRQPREVSLDEYDILRWLDTEKFLAVKDGNLYLGSVNGGNTLVDSGISEFDYFH